MAYAFGSLDATLAAAAGDDQGLHAELRLALIEAVERQVGLLGRSRCDGNWTVASLRLRGLAASFHSGQLGELAERALQAAPGEPTVLRDLSRFAVRLRSSG